MLFVSLVYVFSSSRHVKKDALSIRVVFVLFFFFFFLPLFQIEKQEHFWMPRNPSLSPDPNPCIAIKQFKGIL